METKRMYKLKKKTVGRDRDRAYITVKRKRHVNRLLKTRKKNAYKSKKKELNKRR